MSSLSKHFISAPQEAVEDALTSLTLLNPSVSLDVKYRVLYQSKPSLSTVSLISGGGSGHEPAHAGLVGKGMLTAAVAGSIFASPNVGQIKRSLQLVSRPDAKSKGALFIVKNYTGDVLNFGLAAEQYRASLPRDQPFDIRQVVVGDDVAVGKAQGGIVGRRGLAGTVLVHKITGALAQEGASLDDVESIAKYVAENTATYGVGLEHCHIPGTDAQSASLKSDELELGMGIHNEPGFAHLQPYPPLPKLVAQMFDSILSTPEQDNDRGFLTNLRHDGKDEVVLLVNNLGSLSQLEMGVVLTASLFEIRRRGLIVRRVLMGSYMTSLNMPGFSLTVLVLPREGSNFSSTEILELLDAPTDAPGWPWHATVDVKIPSENEATAAAVADTPQTSVQLPPLQVANPKAFVESIRKAANALIAAEPEITRQDTVAGDGDAGLTLKSGATALLHAIDGGKINGNNLIADVLAIAGVIDSAMGGTSGVLYSIYFSALANSLRTVAESAGKESTTVSLAIWAKSVNEALQALYKYTRARPPSRTLVDPLSAFASALLEPNASFSSATAAAHEAAENTKHIHATAGRGAYVDRGKLEESGVPDPGAWGVWVILNALSSRA